MIDGEAVILGVDGISDFNALHSAKHNEEVQLCAFDLLALDGDDLRDLPLSMRKANLARLLRGRPDGIFVSDFEKARSAPTYSARPASVSKHRDKPYRGGRQKHWIKVKNRKHHAFERAAIFVVVLLLTYVFAASVPSPGRPVMPLFCKSSKIAPTELEALALSPTNRSPPAFT